MKIIEHNTVFKGFQVEVSDLNLAHPQVPYYLE